MEVVLEWVESEAGEKMKSVGEDTFSRSLSVKGRREAQEQLRKKFE